MIGERIRAMIADKGYDADAVREELNFNGIEAVIPPKANRTKQRSYDKDLYQARHRIENFFAPLKQYRAMATRYDKRARTFLAAVYRAASLIGLN